MSHAAAAAWLELTPFYTNGLCAGHGTMRACDGQGHYDLMPYGKRHPSQRRHTATYNVLARTTAPDPVLSCPTGKTSPRPVTIIDWQSTQVPM
jgi:hypothetical protein